MSRTKPSTERQNKLTMTARRHSSTTVQHVQQPPKNIWPWVVCLCIISSLLAQCIAPLLQEVLKSSFICINPLVPSATKKIFDCVGQERTQKGISRRSRSDVQRVTYFDEPFPVEPWSRDDELAQTYDLLLPVTPKKQLSAIPDPFTEAEAVAALQAAKRSREGGNIRRAEAIIEHAYALAPHHPDVLTEYGIFIETIRNNVVEAEGYYQKALKGDPMHQEALIRRAKTLPLVEEIDNNMLKSIRHKRELFLKIPRWNSGLKRAMRESYFQHIYHTVALEGNTFTLGQTRSVLESRLAVGGKSIMEHNEILGMDAALRYLNKTLAAVGDIKMEDILSIHKRVLGFVDPDSAGVIRRTQVFVGSFTPVAPEYVNSELLEFVEWLNDEETLRIDPVELAALAHYKLVFIHPFVDGNGRTARLLMNFILMQAGFPPVIIPVGERGRYYATLKDANDGDLRPFIRFIAQMTDDCLQSFILSSSECPPEVKIEVAESQAQMIQTEP
uniref:protein adenylyltransferase n=1 Tax=Panagrellus redivivus TaxID=6233 RepID=A0A7E4VR13_PANRE